MAASIEQVNMIEGALLPKVLRFLLPLAATGVLQRCSMPADVIVVGNSPGRQRLPPVGATTALINLLVNAFMGISVGVNILVARYLGCREDERVRACVHTAFALSLLLGLVVMAAGLTLSTPMLELMKTPKDVLPLSSLYLRIYFLGIPGTIMYNFGAALLRAFGDTKRPMLFLTISGIVNACLNLFFVIVCGMSVDGVGDRNGHLAVYFTFPRRALPAQKRGTEPSGAEKHPAGPGRVSAHDSDWTSRGFAEYAVQHLKRVDSKLGQLLRRKRRRGKHRQLPALRALSTRQ